MTARPRGVVRPGALVARRPSRIAAGSFAMTCVLTSCHGQHAAPRDVSAPATAITATATPSPAPSSRTDPAFRHPIPGMPPVIDNDVSSHTRAGMLARRVRQDAHYLYVPDSQG